MSGAILFPGQGAQMAQMGRDLAEKDHEAMELWKKAERISGLPLRGIYWDGAEEDMNDTQAVQPALTCVNYTLWHALRKEKPQAFAGHSLGEFSALACAGVLSIEDVLTCTSIRGRLMQAADPEGKGGMAAVVKLSVEDVANFVQETNEQTGEFVCLANYNTPMQTVVSGTKRALNVIVDKAKKQKGRAILLKVSGAFHSPMMQEANAELVTVLEKLNWQKAKVAVYSNVDGQASLDSDVIKAKMLVQMVSPVFWIKTIQNQYASGIRQWLEIGPKSLLNKMVTACLHDVSDHIETAEVTNLPTVEQRNEE
ncbi:MAG: ACP S-malonyltransferase [Desulfovibrio sp.]|nr:ACP S-malonyltransferase [Desulfovibrio sp.]